MSRVPLSGSGTSGLWSTLYCDFSTFVYVAHEIYSFIRPVDVTKERPMKRLRNFILRDKESTVKSYRSYFPLETLRGKCDSFTIMVQLRRFSQKKTVFTLQVNTIPLPE